MVLLTHPHFYLTLMEINTALVAAGHPAHAQSQPSVTQPLAPMLPLPSTQTVMTSQPEIVGTNNLSAPMNVTGTPFIVFKL
jgi:hypothetical protein